MDLAKLMSMPEVASLHGYEIDMMIYLLHLIMLALFIGWGIFFTLAIFKFHKKHHPKANYHGVQNHVSNLIEIGVVIAEAILLIGFSIPFWAKQVNAFPNRNDIFEVRVVAEQFAWNIHYPGPDGIFGKTNVKFFDKQSNPLGLDSSDPDGRDDIITMNQLHLPIGRPALIHLSAKDVMHSFSLPVMRVKQDIIPGMSTSTWFIPTKTGNFEIACAQLCGLGHYRMKGALIIHSQEDFKKWLSEQKIPSREEGSVDDFWN